MEDKELEKYIFDPKNPKGCKVYKLLLNILKNRKNVFSFVSPVFLTYFFRKEIITKDFKNAVWDIPNNFDNLNISEKLNLYIQQYSKEELKEYLTHLKFNNQHLLQKIFKLFLKIESDLFLNLTNTIIKNRK